MARSWQRLALWLLVVAGACSTPTAYTRIPANLREQMEQAATLGPGDVFDVRVYGEPDLTGSYQVSPKGEIRFPFLDDVHVEGLTPQAVAEVLSGRLREGFLREPQVTVLVKEYRSKRIYVLGQVNRPGTFPYQEQMSIVQAVTLAGGFRPVANKNFTIVTRVDNGLEQRIPVPVDKISEGLAPNFVLRPGDIVFVPETIL